MSEETDRLFVPLNTEPYRAFERGEKTAEFRGVNNQFNHETVCEGRVVELRRGYSTDDSLWGVITDVSVGDNLIRLVEEHGQSMTYGDRSVAEVAHSANQLVGDYEEYIVFEVDLDAYVGGEETND